MVVDDWIANWEKLQQSKAEAKAVLDDFVQVNKPLLDTYSALKDKVREVETGQKDFMTMVQDFELMKCYLCNAESFGYKGYLIEGDIDLLIERIDGLDLCFVQRFYRCTACESKRNR